MSQIDVPIDQLTFNENPQTLTENVGALDNVVDPLTDFQVTQRLPANTTNEAYNISKRSTYVKKYKIENELAKVHKSPTFQNHGALIASNMSLYCNNLEKKCSSVPNIIDILNSSNGTSSNVSSMSDLIEINEEFYNKNSMCSFKQDVDTSNYKLNSDDLRAKLQNVLIENEKHKHNLSNVEHKLELDWNEKYQYILRQNAQYEGQIKFLEAQYDFVVNERDCLIQKLNEPSHSMVDNTRLQSKINGADKLNNELTSKLVLATNELKQWHSEATKFESENEQLRLSLQDMKMELDSKIGVLAGLKNKITEQHIDLQNSMQSNLKLNHKIDGLVNEMDAVKKSEKWYIEQLRACQQSKSNVQQELMLTQSNLITQTNKIDTLKLDLKRANETCLNIQSRSIHEKEKLLNKIKMIETDMLEREASLKCSQNNYVTDDSKLKNIVQEQQYDLTIQEYENQICALQNTITEKQSYIENVIKENSNYLVLLTSLQKKMNEKEILYQSSLDINRDLEQKCSGLKDNVCAKDQELLTLKNKIVNLEVALHGASQEKLEIDNVVKNIRDDFTKFMKQYNNLKEKLEEKSKIIMVFEQEKQELFMENNWRVCEIEDLQRKVCQMEKRKPHVIESNKLDKEIPILLKHFTNLENEILRHNEVVFTDDKSSQTINDDDETTAPTQLNHVDKKIADASAIINKVYEYSHVEKHDLEKHIEQIKAELDLKIIEIVNSNCMNINQTHTETQTDSPTFEPFENILKLSKLLCGEDTLDSAPNAINFDDILYIIDDNMNKALLHFNTQTSEYTNLQWSNNRLKTHIKSLKSKLFTKLHCAMEKLDDLSNKYAELERKLDEIYNRKCNGISDGNNNMNNSTQTDQIDNAMLQELNYLKTETKKQYSKFEATKHMLLGKARENRQSRKLAEHKLELLQNESQTAKLALDLEIEALKTRCEEYKTICDKLNATIINLEKERSEERLKGIGAGVELENCKHSFKELCNQLEEANNNIRLLEADINDRDVGITEYKRQIFDEKLQVSGLKKQLSSLQMCLDNANQQLDAKNLEIAQLREICDKLNANEHSLSKQLESAILENHECKRKLENMNRKIEETGAKDNLLLGEIKTLSCHLHKVKLELSSAQNKITLLESASTLDKENHQKYLNDLEHNFEEVQAELHSVRNDKYFLQRLCSDLKISLRSTMNKNKAMEKYIENIKSDFKSLSEKQKSDILLSSPSKVNEEYIIQLLEQSTVMPDKPLNDLRNCLDSLKREISSLQTEIFTKTQQTTQI